jgi:hypothetical protein
MRRDCHEPTDTQGYTDIISSMGRETMIIDTSTVFNLINVVILVVTAIILISQINEMRRATYASSYKAVYDMLQADDVRLARQVVFTRLQDKALDSWSEDEIKAAEKVCYTYDCVGIMARNRIVPVKYVADSWGDSLRRSWGVLEPFVKSSRMQRNSGEFWNEYEWLSLEAEKYRKPVVS